MKIFTGTVIGKKLNKTASVSVERVAQHALYGKRLKRTRVYQVHDEIETKIGDTVRFVETRPISKTKRWKVTEVVNNKEPENANSAKGRKSMGKSKAKKNTKLKTKN